MGVKEFNLKAFGFERAHFNKQPDLHLSVGLPRYSADGGTVENANPNFMCACVACEVFDLKCPGERVKANNARPSEHTIRVAKKVVAPTNYLSGSVFGAPNQDLEGLLQILQERRF